MFNEWDLLRWKLEQWDKEELRVYGRKDRCPFDPERERLEKRRRRGRYSWVIESKSNRKMWQRHIRQKFNHIIDHEEAYHPTKHDYHTGGYLTW